MKIRCSVDPVEALRRGIDAPESVVLEVNPALLSPEEREWLAGALRKEQGVDPAAPTSLVFPYPIPAPTVEGLREVIAARLPGAAAPAGSGHGVTTRFDQAPRREERPAAPGAPAGNPAGEVAKAAGFLGLGALMGGMIDRVFGPHPQQPVEVIVEPGKPREGSWGQAPPEEPPAEPSDCCDGGDGSEDSEADLAADDPDDVGGYSDGDYDLV
ncbi:protein of unknown function [Methylacidimicrobium sp. AP8]|uniref:hypothetical protein n=1 Tax=Methylacidimicrobium sp. AP8 TaxID=2730359 RepID=UPI0018C04AF7|nr:hypothetical protein [Methylacidimicrobium sp. AP8]CAB4244347.1 protein of unknown function [Methylacidimicrobium sp. AP8]